MCNSYLLAQAFTEGRLARIGIACCFVDVRRTCTRCNHEFQCIRSALQGGISDRSYKPEIGDWIAAVLAQEETGIMTD